MGANLGVLPPEYNKAVHGPYDPAIYYGKKVNQQWNGACVKAPYLEPSLVEILDKKKGAGLNLGR